MFLRHIIHNFDSNLKTALNY